MGSALGFVSCKPADTLVSKITWVCRHQKDKPFWILLEQEIMGWQWHQVDHMQIICITLQTDNHTSTSPLRPDALPATQPTASSTEGNTLIQLSRNITKATVQRLVDRNEGITLYYNRQMHSLREVLEMVHTCEHFQCCWMATHFHSYTEHRAVLYSGNIDLKHNQQQ